jgi:hypothetical protein
MAFHPEQREAATQIINKFTQDQPFTILLAQMQSGKTGTYLFTAFEMIKTGIIEKVIIICGSSDTSLRDQASSDMVYSKQVYLDEIDPEGNLPRRVTDKFNNISVFFSQDLKKVPGITENTLIIHEESHMAQSKNNIPFKKFYQKNNLDKALFGDFTRLREANNYILGVSATPFSEIVANKKVQTKDWTSEESNLLRDVQISEKNFHFMEPGQGYIGVTDMILNGSIRFESESIKTSGCEHIASILRKNLLKYDKKYAVIRTHCAEKDKDMLMSIASSCGYDYKSVFGGEGGSLKFMNSQPQKATVIHICGRFRMGQVVPKHNIAMVYEQSNNPNADTILQGLLGRMCGYSVAGAHTGVDIFVSPKAEELIRKYDRAWSEGQMDVLSEVTKAMNLGGVKRKNGGMIVEDDSSMKWIMTVPIKFTIAQIEKDFGEKQATINDITPIDIIGLLENHPELINNNPDKSSLLEILGGCARVQCPETNPNYLHHNKAYNAKCPKEVSDKYYSSLDQAVDEIRRLNIASYTKKDLKHLNDPKKVRFSPISVYGSGRSSENPTGACYLMGYVHYNPEVHPPESVEIASIDPKCNYVPGETTLEDNTVLEGVNGGQIITFSLDTSDDPDSLEKELRAAILRTTVGHETFIPSATRSINSLFDKKINDYEGIRLDKLVYTAEKIDFIASSLGLELGVKVQFKKSRGRQPKEFLKFASISW